MVQEAIRRLRASISRTGGRASRSFIFFDRAISGLALLNVPQPQMAGQRFSGVSFVADDPQALCVIESIRACAATGQSGGGLVALTPVEAMWRQGPDGMRPGAMIEH